jgi:uncharacterized protein (TIGR02118 family)
MAFSKRSGASEHACDGDHQGDAKFRIALEVRAMTNRRSFIRGAAMSAGAAAIASPTIVSAAAQPTMSLNVVYPAREGARFDADYYRATHIPLAMQIMRADRVLLIEGVPNRGTPPPYVMICHFEFGSPDSLASAVAHPDMARVRADVIHFTDIKPLIMFGRSP